MISLESTPYVVSEIMRIAQKSNTKTTEVAQSELESIAMDSPLSGEQIQASLQIITLLLETGAAFIIIIKELRDFLKNHPKEKIIIYNPKNGDIIGEILNSTQDSEIDNMNPMEK